MPDTFSQQIPELLQSHLEHLTSSAISLDVIRERGYKSMFSEPDLLALGFKKRQLRRPICGILIPQHSTNGGGVFSYQWRPDHPRTEIRDNGKERKIKYENPAGAAVGLDVPPRCKPMLGDPNVPLFITEGNKKGDAIASAGGCVIVLTGVWGFKGKNNFGGTTILADFDSIAWKDRLIYLCFDSDSTSNEHVWQAMQRLSEILKRKGGRVRILKLPPGPAGEKTGADDYLAQGHTLDNLIGCEAIEEIKAPRKAVFENPYELSEGLMTYARGDETPISLGNFSAIISEIIEKDNGRDVNKYFKIIGREMTGKPLPAVEISAKDFESMNWICENWDIRAAISADRSAKARIREALLLLSYNANRRSIYAHTGWSVINGKRTFLTAGGAIGVPEVQVDLEDDDLSDYALPQPVADPGEALRASLSFLDIGSRPLLLALWAAMYMTPLTEIYTPSFTLFVEGISGTMKSGITALALNHFGKIFNYNRLPASWTYTENRIEQMLFTLKDLPLVIDDWAPGKDQRRAKELDAMADRIIRNQANRTGRGRMRSDTSSRKTYKPRGFLITSGEHLPGTYSAAARMHVVEIRKSDLDRVKFFKALEQKHLYSQAMSQYLAFLIAHWDKLAAELPASIARWTTQALEAGKSEHARLPAAVAGLYAGLTTALTMYEEQNIITHEQALSLAREGWDAFLKQSQEQGGRVDAERPGRHFIRLLSSLKDQGRVIFWPVDIDDPRPPSPGQTAIGWADQDGYYLNPEVAFAAVKHFSEDTDQPFTVKENAVWKDLLELEYSNPGSGGRPKCQKRIYGRSNPTWVIFLKPEVL